MLAAVLFTIGAVGVLVRRNVIVMFMCVELMLNAVNLTFVSFARELNDIRGQVIVFFTLVVAAAEVAVGLGIIVAIFRRRRGATADDLDLLRDGAPVSDRDILDLVWIVPALPLLGAVAAPDLRQAHRRTDRGLDRHRPHGARVRLVDRDVRRDARPARRGARQRRHTSTPGSRPDRLQVDMGFYADPLSVTWILLVTGVGSLIHLYSIGYMHGDARYSRFFAYLNLFAASMLDPRARVELPRHVPRLGGRRPLLVPARLVLVRAQRGRGGGEEGVRHQPRRRRRLPARDVPDLRVVPHRSTTPR